MFFIDKCLWQPLQGVMAKIERKKYAQMAFSRSNQGLRNPLYQLEGAVKSRRLQPKHYEAAMRYFDSYLSTLLDPFAIQVREFKTTNQRTRKKDRKLTFYSIGFRIDNIDDPNHSTQKYVFPTYQDIVIRSDMVRIQQRRLPVLFSYEHVDDRFWEKTGQSAKYENQDIKNSFVMATMISQVLSKRMQDNEKLQPVIIPNKEGLFIGIAEKHNDFICPLHDRVTFHGGQTFIPKDTFSTDTKCEIHVFTFVPLKSFVPEQERIWQAMMPLLSDEHEFARDAFWRMFEGIMIEDQKELETAVQPLLDRLEQILDMPEWDTIYKMGQSHIVKHFPDAGF